MLDINRVRNQVYSGVWIRNQMCSSNTNYLLKGQNQVMLSDYLCTNATDVELAGVFSLISARLDVTRAKYKVGSIDYLN